MSSTTIRHKASRLRALVMALVLVTGASLTVVGSVEPAAAADGGYPHAGAPCRYEPAGGASCDGPSGAYAWYVDKDGNGKFSGASEDWSERNYGVRNCTDYVAWKLESLGVPTSKTRSLGDGGSWAANAAAKGVKVNGTPAAGSVAVTVGAPGHVAYVESVNSDGTITVSEFNYNKDGNYNNTRMGTPAALGFTKFAHFEEFMTNPPGGSTGGSSGGGTTSTGLQVLLDGSSTVRAKTGIGAGGWTQETDPGTAKAIAASSTGVQMMINGCSAVWAKENNIAYGNWVQETACGTAKQIAVGGKTQLLLDGCSAVWAKDTIGAGGWTQETACGTATAIAVSSTGVQMMIDGCSGVWAKKSIGAGGWTQEAGCGTAKAIAVGGDTQLIIDGCSAVHAKNTVSVGGWIPETACGTAKAIAVSSTGVQMLIDGNSAVWAKTGIGAGGWTQETAQGVAKAIAVAGDTQMIIDPCSAVHAKNWVGAGGWVPETACGTATLIAGGA